MTIQTPKAGEIGWNRLLSTDIPAAKNFYNRLFGWETYEVDLNGMPYFIFKLGTRNIAGLMELAPEWQAQNEEIRPHWMSYITVNNIQDTLEKAVHLGAQLIVDTQTIRGLGLIAILRDPTSAYVGLFQPLV